jgi:hypothetical protein
MYSGTTITKFSGRIFGAHQKFNSVARRQLYKLGVPKDTFPSINKILHFEGKNGPDAIKRKSPAKDEPWHYFNPFDDKDTQLIDMIQGHYNQLVKDLKNGNMERVAFEAAWLAHALVDGLTPAHHYPYERTLTELRGGNIHSRTTIKEKLIIQAETTKEKLKKNWKVWGPKGLMTSHGLFELGIATLIKPLTFSESLPTKRDRNEFAKLGITEWFKRSAREVAVLDIYSDYIKNGWTPKLAWQVRHKLGPIIVQTVTLAWYQAAVDAKHQ